MSKNVMIFEYDYENDILFFHQEKDYKYEFSDPLTEFFIIDFNKNKIPIGLEILDASKLFKVKKYLLNNIKEGNLKISINKKEIIVNLILSTEIHNKSTQMLPVNINGDNDIDIPVLNTEMAVASA